MEAAYCLQATVTAVQPPALPQSLRAPPETRHARGSSSSLSPRTICRAAGSRISLGIRSIGRSGLVPTRPGAALLQSGSALSADSSGLAHRSGYQDQAEEDGREVKTQAHIAWPVPGLCDS